MKAKIPKLTEKKRRMGALGPLIGLSAIALGAYNLLAMADIITKKITIPQIVANIILVLAGLFLLVNAYRLRRLKYHTKHLF